MEFGITVIEIEGDITEVDVQDLWDSYTISELLVEVSDGGIDLSLELAKKLIRSETKSGGERVSDDGSDRGGAEITVDLSLSGVDGSFGLHIVKFGLNGIFSIDGYNYSKVSLSRGFSWYELSLRFSLGEVSTDSDDFA